jgi:hypothetical protein
MAGKGLLELCCLRWGDVAPAVLRFAGQECRHSRRRLAPRERQAFQVLEKIRGTGFTALMVSDSNGCLGIWWW